MIWILLFLSIAAVLVSIFLSKPDERPQSQREYYLMTLWDESKKEDPENEDDHTNETASR